MNEDPSNGNADIHPEDELFYFESDHLALRGNKDYSELLKTLFILTAQQERAIKDYDKVAAMKHEALNDPAKVIEKLQQEGLDIPPLQRIANVPLINWDKYNVKIPEHEIKQIYEDKKTVKSDNEEHRKKNTYNRQWTPEEQKRLEELLVIYPPEPIENNRFRKISAALGTRTPQQVCSRLQKYFIKLFKAGLPIPGRIPKSVEGTKRKSLKYIQKYNHYLWKPTTFFPEFDVPVAMNEAENIPGPSQLPGETKSSTSSIANSHNYLLPVGYHQESEPVVERTQSELQLELLQRVKQEKLKEKENPCNFHHYTFKCDYCGEEPIVGTRWHCGTCTMDSVDFCTDCVVAQMYSDKCHPFTHSFVTFPENSGPPSMDSSDSDSENGPSNSNTNYASDSDNYCDNNTKSKFHELGSNEKGHIATNGKVVSRDAKRKSNTSDFLFDSYLNEQMYNTDNSNSLNSVQDTSYDYLHSNLFLNEQK